MSFKDKIFKNQSPWGTPPGGSPGGNGSGTRREPPNLDDLIKNFQKTVKVKRNTERKYSDNWQRQRKLERKAKQLMQRKVA